MINNIQLYKSISLDIIELFKNKELDQLDGLLNKRQEILDEEVNNKSFKQSLTNEGILDIDKKIQYLLSESIDEVKEEIRVHKKINIANTSYINFNKQNLNIFNKKV